LPLVLPFGNHFKQFEAHGGKYNELEQLWQLASGGWLLAAGNWDIDFFELG